MQLDIPEISMVRGYIKSLKISQLALADQSGVSQSVISRILTGEIRDPSYATIRKLLIALNHFKFRHAGQDAELTAEKVMNGKLYAVSPHHRLKDAWGIMKARNFSQIPVLDEKNSAIGSISESFLALHATEYDMEKRLEEVAIEDPFPTVGKNTYVSTLVDILRSRQAILVAEKGRAIGIITKHDLIEKR